MNSSAVQSTPRPGLSDTAYPLLFVALWSTGFIGAKLGLPFVEPLTFLAVRFAIVTVLMLAVVLRLASRYTRRESLISALPLVPLVAGPCLASLSSIATGASNPVSKSSWSPAPRRIVGLLSRRQTS